MDEYLVLVNRTCSGCEGSGLSVHWPLRDHRCTVCGGHGRSTIPLATALQLLYDQGLWPGEPVDARKSEAADG